MYGCCEYSNSCPYNWGKSKPGKCDYKVAMPPTKAPKTPKPTKGPKTKKPRPTKGPKPTKAPKTKQTKAPKWPTAAPGGSGAAPTLDPNKPYPLKGCAAVTSQNMCNYPCVWNKGFPPEEYTPKYTAAADEEYLNNMIKLEQLNESSTSSYYYLQTHYILIGLLLICGVIYVVYNKSKSKLYHTQADEYTQLLV
eukprot:UN12043